MPYSPPAHRRPLRPHLLLVMILMHCTACEQEKPARPKTPATAGTSQVQAHRKLPTRQRLAGQDWPVFLGLQGDGSSNEIGVDPALWQPIPPLLWSIELGTGYGAPTISAGKSFQFDRHGDAERLTCYSAETGQELWHWQAEVQYDDYFGYNNGPRCSPLVDDWLVYVYGVTGNLYGCSGRNGPNTDFRCVRLSDGEVMWTDRDRQRQRSSQLLVDGYLVVLGETGTLELIRPSPDGLQVLRRANLSESNDPRSGEPLIEYPCWAAPVVSHGLLYIRGNHRLLCLDLIPQ